MIVIRDTCKGIGGVELYKGLIMNISTSEANFCRIYTTATGLTFLHYKERNRTGARLKSCFKRLLTVDILLGFKLRLVPVESVV